MKRIVLDYLDRWKWVYASGFVIHSVMMVFGWWEADKTIPAGIFLGSAFHLMFEFFRSGGSRTMLTLPVTTGGLARAWRFVAFTFPSLLYLVALVVSAIIAAIIRPSSLLNFERFVILAAFQTAMLGTMFFALTGLPSSPAEQRTVGDQVQAGFMGLIWGFSIPGCFFLGQAIPENFASLGVFGWLIGAGLALMAVLGWTRAESLVLKRAQQPSRVRSSTRPARKNPDTAKVRSRRRRFGGVPFHCIHQTRMAGFIGLLMILFNWGWMQFFSSDPSPQNLAARHQFTASQINFVVPIMAGILGITSLTQLRTFRTLPLSREKIAGILVLWPLVFGAIFGLGVVALHRVWFGPPFLWGHFFRALAGASFLMLVVPVFLRLGFTLKGFILIFLMFPAVQAFQLFDDRFNIPDSVPWILTLAFTPVAFGLAFYLLNTSYPWRAGALRMKGMLRR